MMRGTQTAGTPSRGRWFSAASLFSLALAGCGGGGGSGSSQPLADSSGNSPAASPPAGYAQFIYPTPGQLSVSKGQAFQWSAVSGAASYQLQLGSSYGANDIFDSGAITATSVTLPQLPAAGVVYARVRAVPSGWSTALPPGYYPRGTYATFRTDVQVAGASFTYPVSNGTADGDTPIAWTADPVAQGYRLVLVNASDGSMLLDTGTIHSTLRVVSGLPAGAKINATLSTYYTQNITKSQTLSFTVGNPAVSVAGMLAVARSLGAAVRLMADLDNQPHDGTPLAIVAAAADAGAVDCVAFSNALVAELADANMPLQYRTRGVCFNSPDCHELVEVLDSDHSRWVTVDPTFGLYTLNAAAQAATVEEISAAARTADFGSLSYVYLTSSGNTYAKAYYLDYPTLFLGVYAPGTIGDFEEPPVASLEPYYDLVGPSVNGPNSGFYAIQCAAGSTSATANWDGTVRSDPCQNGFTPVAYGYAVSLVTGDPSAAAIWTPHRFAF